MDLPSSLIIKSGVFQPKGLYKFSSEALNTDEPHYFLIVEIEGKLFHMVVCTSQFEKKKKYLAYAGIDESTLVWVKPGGDNGLTKDSFVNCNTVFSHYTIDDLETKLLAGALTFEGHISDSEYYQVMNGIINSPTVDKGVITIVKAKFDKFNE